MLQTETLPEKKTTTSLEIAAQEEDDDSQDVSGKGSNGSLKKPADGSKCDSIMLVSCRSPICTHMTLYLGMMS